MLMFDFIHGSIIFLLMETLRKPATRGHNPVIVYLIGKRTWVKLEVRR